MRLRSSSTAQAFDPAAGGWLKRQEQTRQEQKRQQRTRLQQTNNLLLSILLLSIVLLSIVARSIRRQTKARGWLVEGADGFKLALFVTAPHSVTMFTEDADAARFAARSIGEEFPRTGRACRAGGTAAFHLRRRICCSQTTRTPLRRGFTAGWGSRRRLFIERGCFREKRDGRARFTRRLPLRPLRRHVCLAAWPSCALRGAWRVRRRA